MNSEEIFDSAFKFIECKNFNKALSEFQRLDKDIRAKLNICIIYDIIREGENLISNLPDPSSVDSKDLTVWYSLGLLFHKINEFDNAIICFDQCLKIKPEYIPALIKKGYSLEAAEPHRLEEAIKCFTYILNINSEEVEIDFGEIYHGLGHFYTELGKAREGMSYMRKAMIEDVNYITCYGTCYSEQKKYSQALDIFKNALTREGLKQIYGNDLPVSEISRRYNFVQENEELKNELMFYQGEAYWGIGDYEKAIECFERFKRYCLATQNHDGLAHACLYTTKATLKISNILLTEQNELEDLQKRLTDNNFSVFANKYIRNDHSKTISIINKLLLLKHLLNDYQASPKKISDAANELLSLCNDKTILYHFFSDINTNISFKSSYLCEASFEEMNVFHISSPRFVICEVHGPLKSTVVQAFFHYLGKLPLVVLKRNSEIDLFEYLGAKVHDLLIFETIEDLESVLLLIGAYEKIKNNLLETVFLFGLTPNTAAPSFSAQTGVLEFLKYKG